MRNGVRVERSAKYGRTISLPDGTEFGFTFGERKARLIVEHLEAICAFVGVSRVEVTVSPEAKPEASGSVHKDETVAVKGDDAALDAKLRGETACRGCGGGKGDGLLVCWGCFKRHPKAPLKTSGMGVGEWLAKYGVRGGNGGGR